MHIKSGSIPNDRSKCHCVAYCCCTIWRAPVSTCICFANGEVSYLPMNFRFPLTFILSYFSFCIATCPKYSSISIRVCNVLTRFKHPRPRSYIFCDNDVKTSIGVCFRRLANQWRNLSNACKHAFLTAGYIN